MKLKIWYNVLLVRLGVRQLLPSDYINGIRIVDNKDPMVELPSNEGLHLANGKSGVGRKQMVERLLKAAEYVTKHNCRLLIFQTYRSPKEQSERRDSLYEAFKEKYPDYDEKEILRMLNASIAKIGGGHQTGGAVDLGLCDKNGNELYMGTRYLEHNDKTATLCKSLNEEQQRNRAILLQAMHAAGFVNYPAEWWHFSYGDRMWAAYRHERYSIYGPITLD